MVTCYPLEDIREVCSSCDFDFYLDIWPKLSPPCVEGCAICEKIECESCLWISAIHNFYVRNTCKMCYKPVRYTYYDKETSLWLWSTNLSDLHHEVAKSKIKYCCLIKSPFLFRNHQLRCVTCLRVLRGKPRKEAHVPGGPRVI